MPQANTNHAFAEIAHHVGTARAIAHESEMRLDIITSTAKRLSRKQADDFRELLRVSERQATERRQK